MTRARGTRKNNGLRRTAIAALLAVLPFAANAQTSRLGEGVVYSADITAAAGSGSAAPFWFTNNRYGLGTDRTSYGFVRAAVGRDVMCDSLRRWKVGYGADLVVARNMNSNFVVQQLYTDIQWRKIRLTIGQKEFPLELKNQRLSSGGMTSGINARPIPQIRLEYPHFVDIKGTCGWLAMKGHISFGWYADGVWQRQFNNGNKWSPYTRHSKYHSKALFARVGNKDKFPLFLTCGLETSSQFGGEAWNLADRADHNDPDFSPYQNLNDGFLSYWHAFTFSGSDVNDGNYANVAGNHLGSWHMRLDYKGKAWGAGFYFEHFFEDHSQLFWQYGWKDMLYGAEITFPRNRFVSGIVYEHIGTMDQSGPIYHDRSENLDVQISGVDNYYNNHIYGAWQHAGFVMGNPLLLSPLYNHNGALRVQHNRIRAHHAGLAGNPADGIEWRVLVTTEKSYGTYDLPLKHPLRGTYCLAEVSYAPRFAKGVKATVSYACNRGKLLGKSNGAMISLTYSGRTKNNKDK